MWWGGASYGQRLFADMTPYLTYLLIPFVAWVTSTRTPGRVTLVAVFVVAALASVVVNAQGALNESTARWSAFPVSIDAEPVRVWDWRQPQFLAGITFVPTPLPPVRLDAVACDASPGAPGAPVAVANHGGTVTVQWPPAPGHPALYLLEIGYRPDVTDSIREVRDLVRPSFTTWRVQPGTYYVRVRARNNCGDSPPSAELVVTVQ